MGTVYLSDNEPCEIRTLGIAELDYLAPEPVQKYAYKMRLVTGDEALVEFPIERYTEPPQKPDIEEDEVFAEEGKKSRKWYQYREWQVYQAALKRQQEMAESVAKYLDDVFDHITQNCISETDLNRLVTDEDWDKFYRAALVPQLSEDLLVTTLKKSYKATYNDEEVLAAVKAAAASSGSKGIYDTIRVWENKLMIAMRMTEVEYAVLPLGERARKVVAMKIDEWISYLEYEDRRKKMEQDNLIKGARG